MQRKMDNQLRKMEELEQQLRERSDIESGPPGLPRRNFASLERLNLGTQTPPLWSPRPPTPKESPDNFFRAKMASEPPENDAVAITTAAANTPAPASTPKGSTDSMLSALSNGNADGPFSSADEKMSALLQ